jgi:hypothetical protein
MLLIEKLIYSAVSGICKMKTSIQILLMILALLVLSFYLFIDVNDKYHDRIISTQTGLHFTEQSINQFHEAVGRFPHSLSELDEYARNFPNNIKYYLRPGEGISGSKSKSRTEHKILDGTGGMFYDPNTGMVKINLTNPLKSYWILYIGPFRNKVPSDW